MKFIVHLVQFQATLCYNCIEEGYRKCINCTEFPQILLEGILITIKDDKIYLKHIIESIDNVEDFTKDVSKSDFLSSALIQNAVIRCLEIIGEAVKNLPMEFREKYPDIEWKKIAGLRDVLIHAYFDVDIDLTWDIIKDDLPDLKKKIKIILGDMEKPE